MFMRRVLSENKTRWPANGFLHESSQKQQEWKRVEKVDELSIKWFYVQILTVIVLPFPPYAPKPLLAYKHTQVWEWVDTLVLKKDISNCFLPHLIKCKHTLHVQCIKPKVGMKKVLYGVILLCMFICLIEQRQCERTAKSATQSQARILNLPDF